jgi:uncharacterized metal-binding protein YceD (DUF177 family)
MNTTPEFSFLVDCNKLQEIGRTLETEANTSEREALATRFNLLSLDKLILKAFVSRQSSEDVLLNCNFKAIYKQKCIVSLKPLKKEIDCSFQRIYSSNISEDFEHESEPQQEYIEDSKEFQDPPDPLIDGFFNLGESVAEQLSLEIDPFPRSKGVNFDGFSSYRGEQISEISTNPFAVLEQLKKKL